MRIISGMVGYIPAWVHSDVLEYYWGKNLDNYVDNSEDEPKNIWFDCINGEKYFCTANIVITFEENCHKIHFNGGRNRTRWLLQKGLIEVPIAIRPSELELAVRMQLFSRPVKEFDTLSV